MHCDARDASQCRTKRGHASPFSPFETHMAHNHASTANGVLVARGAGARRQPPGARSREDAQLPHVSDWEALRRLAALPVKMLELVRCPGFTVPCCMAQPPGTAPHFRPAIFMTPIHTPCAATRFAPTRPQSTATASALRWSSTSTGGCARCLTTCCGTARGPPAGRCDWL